MKEELLKKIELKEKELQKIINELKLLKNQLQNFYDSKNNLSKDEEIKIFKSYFRGRDDVYPYLSIDKNGKKYYMPKCKNEWNKSVCYKTMGKKCANCPYRINDELTLNVLTDHLYNNKTIGIYPMFEDETCYFLAFDFDDKTNNKNIKEDILAFSSVCDKYNIPIVLERSRSGSGVHIWIFFEEKIKALTARKLGSLLLSKTMEIKDNLNIASFDRMFPNQDFLPKGGYGNLIALPLQTEPKKYGNTVFVDRNFMMIENQFNYLNSIHKLTKEEVFVRISEISEETIDISHEDLDIKEEVKNKRKNNYSFPKSIDVIFENMIYIDKAELSSSVKNSFRRLASFANPEFYKKQRLRLSVYNTPMVIDCSKETEKYLCLPRGTMEYLKDLCSENNVTINIKDKRNTGEKIDVNFNLSLRDDQKLALNELEKYENGILEAPTAFGKTVVACKLIADKKLNTLIITEKIELLRQWKEKIKENLNIDAGQIGGGKNNVTNYIDVASIKTLWNKGKFNDVVKNYGMIIIDECHHLAAFTYESAVNEVNAKYVYGLSATPEKENGHTPIIKMQCGDIRYKVDAKKFNENLNLPMTVYTKKSHLNFVDKNITDYTINEIYNHISKDIIRNDKVIKDIENEFKEGKNILVLTERLEHLDYLKDKLSKLTDNLFVYHGGLGKKILKQYGDLKETISAKGENKILLATGSTIGEGFDDPSLDVLFLTMPVSGKQIVTQYVGRLHRQSDAKKEIVVYDYVDDNFSQTRNMFEKRKKTYQKLGYKIVEE